MKEQLSNLTELSTVTFSIVENLSILLKSSLFTELMKTVGFISESTPFFKPYYFLLISC